jgi:hypothetical protein
MSTPVEQEIREVDRLEKEKRAQWREEQIKELRLNSRLSFPYPMRLMLATSLSFLAGAGLGISYGAQSAGYRFRAENAHRLPNSSTGWYLYHKSKNYHMAFAGIREGIKMGTKISFWTAGFFSIEEMFDRYRGRRDCFNTIIASLSVAGGFSLWSMQSPPPFNPPPFVANHHRPFPNYNRCENGEDWTGLWIGLWRNSRCALLCKGPSPGLC